MRQALRRSIEHALAGRPTRLGVPLLWPGDRVELARRYLADANLWPCCEPRLLVAELGFKPCAADVRECGGECTDGEIIFYQWDADRRRRGLLLAHGLAHALLMRHYREHSEADAWWLTGDLVVAGGLRHMTIDEVIAEAHAPEWFVRAFAANARVEVLPLAEQMGIRRSTA